MSKLIRILCTILAIGTIFGSTAPWASAAGTSKKMNVYTSASCSSYNHVGNEWAEDFEVNGKKVKNGSTAVSFKAGDTVTVKAVVTEQDDSMDDVGTETVSKTLTQSDIDNGFKISFTVTVTENGGRYIGNEADWTVTFKFS